MKLAAIYKRKCLRWRCVKTLGYKFLTHFAWTLEIVWLWNCLEKWCMTFLQTSISVSALFWQPENVKTREKMSWKDVRNFYVSTIQLEGCNAKGKSVNIKVYEKKNLSITQSNKFIIKKVQREVVCKVLSNYLFFDHIFKGCSFKRSVFNEMEVCVFLYTSSWT